MVAVTDREKARAEAEAVVEQLTDGRKLTPLLMLKLGQARRTLAWLDEATR